MAATTTETAHGVHMIALSAIRHDQNVRQELIGEEIDALARSIDLLGQLTPVSVRPDTEPDRYVLIGGHKRYAALAQLGHNEIRAEIRPDDAGEASERAAENIVRSQLNPSEEALAVKAMLDRGLTEDGAAQALGWPRQRVTARIKLLELPDRARQLIGAGVIPLSAVDHLRAIGQVSSELLEVLVAFLDSDHDEYHWTAGQLASDPGYVLGNAMRQAESSVFAAYLQQLPSRAVDELRLGKKATEQLAEAEKLHKQVNQYAYGPPPVRFTDVDIDQARAAGVLIEFENSQPIIVDRSLYRELAKQAIERTVEQLRADAERTRTERKQAGKQRAAEPADPVEAARQEHTRRTRELADQAHGANVDLGWALMNNLATVDPSDIAVARFFVFALLGSDYDGSPYTQSGDLIAELAVRGIRLVIEDFRTDVTKTLKSGERGKLRIDYGEPKQPEKPIAWLWKFIDGAKTAGELYGRALVVIAAEQHACRLALPSSQRYGAKRWPSHKDHAAKALAKLAGPHLPASLKQLEKAVAKASRDLHDVQETARAVSRRSASAVDAADEDIQDRATGEGPAVDDAERDVEDLDELAENDVDHDEVAGAIGPDGAVYSDADPGL